MNAIIRYGTDHIDWDELCRIFPLAPLGTRDPVKLRQASKNSHTVISVYADNTLIGFGRALSDGCYQSAVYDVVVLPDFQGQGIGRAIMTALLDRLPPDSTIFIYVAPGKQVFYEQLGFGHLTTGMGRFPDPEKSRANGYLR